MEVTGPDREVTERQLRARLEGERANARHWRRVAREQSRALDAIKSRTSVRAVLALDRRTRPLRIAMAARRAEIRRWIDRLGLAARALLRRPRVGLLRARLRGALERLPEPPPLPRTVSIVTVGGPPGEERGVGGLAAGAERLLVEPAADSVAAAADRGARATAGDLVCFLAPTSEPLAEGWLGRLVAAIQGDTVAATPLLLHPARRLRAATPHDLQVRELGLDVVTTGEGVPTVRAREAGSAAAPERPATEVVAASGACLVVDRCAYDAAGGLAPLDDVDAAAVDLCWRLRARGGRVVAVPGSVVADHRPVRSARELDHPVDPQGAGWRAVIDRHGPALVRSAGGPEAAGPLRIAVTVAAPSAKMAPRWGDWHLAEALARSLRRLGYPVRVQTADRADAPAGRSCDVHLVLRGMQPVRRTPGQRHVLWVISHPEALDVGECDEADLVLVASARFAAELRDRTATPVEVLLQATDHHRFRPLPPDPRHAHPVAVVAKTRDVLRPIVADALAAGLRPAIYGTGWEPFAPQLVVADYVPNEDLPAVYSSVGVLLNDHWDTMRAWGFPSNRLFDALACGTTVISDHLPELADLFGDAVTTYRDPDDLRALVDAALGDPITSRRRAEAGRETVLGAHTFDHRARELLDLLARHGLDGIPGCSG